MLTNRIAVWMAVCALGITGVAAGCDGDDESGTTGNTTTTDTDTGTGTGTDTGTGTNTGEGGGGQGGGGQGGGGGGTGSERAFRLTGMGFDPHAGQMIRVEGIAEGGANEEIAAVEVAADGTFTAEGMIMADKAYQIVYFADMNANNSCDEVPTDHVWELTVDAGTADEEQAVTHNTDFGSCLQ